MLKPQKLSLGDTIGIIAPCIALTKEEIAVAKKNMEQVGFQVKFADNAFKNTYGFAATPEERTADLHQMITDTEVKMLLFGGGEVCNEMLPYLDFDLIQENPKIICSYSDSTTLLNAISAHCHMVTYYGFTWKAFTSPVPYNMQVWENRLMAEKPFMDTGSKWRTICPGSAEGETIGGFLANFAIMLNGAYFPYDKSKKYILFIEDHIRFSKPAMVSKYFSHIEQSGFMKQVTGLLFGHYSEDYYEEIEQMLQRIGERYQIPVAKCDDFGHGTHHGIIPIGVQATLNADQGTLKFQEKTLGHD